MIQITGKVIHGQKYGRVLGFPTANLDRRQYVREKMKIRFGVWAGEIKLKVKSGKLKVYKAGVIIGPLDKRRLPKIEAHLINFKGNLYGKKITVSLKSYLRKFAEYKNVSSLKKQIQKDLRKIRKVL